MHIWLRDPQTHRAYLAPGAAQEATLLSIPDELIDELKGLVLQKTGAFALFAMNGAQSTLPLLRCREELACRPATDNVVQARLLVEKMLAWAQALPMGVWWTA